MELVIEGVPSKSFVLDWPEELNEEKKTRLQAVLDAQAVYTLGFYKESTIVNTEGDVGKREVLRKLKVMVKKANLDPEKLRAAEALDLYQAELWVAPYAKPATISAGSSTDPPAETTPATVAWLGKAPASLTVIRTSHLFRQLEWLQYRAGLCGIELKKEPESFPAFLALFLDITRYAEGDKLNRMAGATSLWEVRGRQAEGEGAELGDAGQDPPDQRGGTRGAVPLRAGPAVHQAVRQDVQRGLQASLLPALPRSEDQGGRQLHGLSESGGHQSPPRA